MDCSTSGFPVHHQLSELAQTHVHWVSDAIQPSRPLVSPSPLPSIFPSVGVFCTESGQFFASGGQSIGASASVLPMNIQDWIPLGLTGLISLQYKGLSRVFSNNLQMAESVVADLRIWRDLEYWWLTINRLSTVQRVRTPKPSVVQRSTVISTWVFLWLHNERPWNNS